MLIMKMALLSCAIYLSFALVAQLALIAFAHWKGGGIFLFNGWSWTLISGAAWLVSTSLAFRLITSGLRARLSRYGL
jgi:hypothetical protein